MKRSCVRWLEGVTGLAHGEHHAGAAAHVAECADCRDYLHSLEGAISGLRADFEDAPAEAVSAAKAVFPRPTPTHARLVTTSLGLSGARGGESFQSVYEFDGGDVRVMYKPDPNGWQVMGRVVGGGWIGEPAEIDDEGRFEFTVPDLSQAEIRLTRAGFEVVIDAPNASTSNG